MWQTWPRRAASGLRQPCVRVRRGGSPSASRPIGEASRRLAATVRYGKSMSRTAVGAAGNSTTRVIVLPATLASIVYVPGLSPRNT
jgi:hypothetical protein